MSPPWAEPVRYRYEALRWHSKPKTPDLEELILIAVMAAPGLWVLIATIISARF